MSLASKASKRTFYGSIVFTLLTVAGAHYAQKVESENMYQGVVKDEARRKERAQSKVTHLSDVLPDSISALAPDAIASIPMPSIPSPSTVPAILGYDPPVAKPAGSKSEAQKEMDKHERQRDFVMSQQRQEKLLRDQSLADDAE